MKYIAFEGPDGCGKTTQTRALSRYLTGAGFVVKEVHQPGSTHLGEVINNLVKGKLTNSTIQGQPVIRKTDDERSPISISEVAERLLFAADDAEFQDMLFARSEADFIVADRYSPLSTVFYGMAGGLKSGDIDSLLIAMEGMLSSVGRPRLYPDALVIIAPPCDDEWTERMSKKKLDSIESRGKEYFDKVKGFYQDKGPDAWVKGLKMVIHVNDVDDMSPNQIHHRVLQVLFINKVL